MAGGILAARGLGREQYGWLGMTLSTLDLFGILGGLGLGLMATKYVAEHRATDPGRAGRVLGLALAATGGMALLCAVGTLAGADWMATRWLHNPALADGLRASAGLILTSILHGTLAAGLAGFHAFKQISLVGCASGVLRLAGTILALSVWGTIPSLLYTWLASDLVLLGWSTSLLHRQTHANGVRIRLTAGGVEVGALLKTSLPWFLSGLAAMAGVWFVRVLLTGVPDGYAELGLLAAAMQWYNAILFVPSAMGQVGLPLLCGMHGENDHAGAGRLLWSMAGIRGGLAVAVAAPIALASAFIIRIYGPGFEAGRVTLLLFCGAAVLEAVGSSLALTLTATGRLWLQFGYALVRSGVIIGLAGMLVARWGSAGVGLAMVAGAVIHGLLLLWSLRHTEAETVLNAVRALWNPKVEKAELQKAGS